MEVHEVAQRLDEISIELRDEYRELAEKLSLEKKRKNASFRSTFGRQSNGKLLNTTDVGRFMDVDADEPARERIEIEGNISALEEERDHLRFFIKYGLTEFARLERVPRAS